MDDDDDLPVGPAIRRFGFVIVISLPAKGASDNYGEMCLEG